MCHPYNQFKEEENLILGKDLKVAIYQASNIDAARRRVAYSSDDGTSTSHLSPASHNDWIELLNEWEGEREWEQTDETDIRENKDHVHHSKHAVSQRGCTKDLTQEHKAINCSFVQQASRIQAGSVWGNQLNFDRKAGKVRLEGRALTPASRQRHRESDHGANQSHGSSVPGTDGPQLDRMVSWKRLWKVYSFVLINVRMAADD